MSVPFISFAQTGTTTTPAPTTGTITITNPGLLPDDFLYFLDRWSEALNMAITFNKEKKARKHLEYAKERVAEMGEVLKDSTAKLEDIADAKADFDERVQEAALLVKEEKDKGSDVKNLARELDDELDSIAGSLKDIFKEHKNESSRAESEIRAKLASLAPGDPQIQGLTQALESIMKEKNDADKEDGDVDSDLDDEAELFEEGMGKEVSAQKHIDEAIRLKAHIDSLGGQLSAIVVASYQDLLSKAQAADVRGDFEAAKELSKQAIKVLERAKDLMDESDALKMGMPVIGGKMEDGTDVGEMFVNDLEKELKKGEKMMEGFGGGESSNDTNDDNR